MNVLDARKVASFVGIDERVNGKPVALTVPGHDGRKYKVRLDRSRKLSYWCGCKGSAHSVCYHGIAAVMRVAREKGWKVSWTRGQSEAIRLSNLGGRPLSLTSERSRVTIWAVVKGRTRVQIESVVPRIEPHRWTVIPPSMRVKGGSPPRLVVQDREGLVIWVGFGEVRVGKNIYAGSSVASRKRLDRVLQGLWKEGRATPCWAQGEWGYQLR